MSTPTTIALVGVTSGAGTTRLSLEFAAALATDGRDVTVFDMAFVTRGLSDYVSGTLDPDVTALVTDAIDVPLESGLVAFETDAEGRVAVCPAVTPFERLARTMTPGTVRASEDCIVEVADGSDHVLVDAPLLASNQTVAATAACDRVVFVASATDHGVDAVDRLSARAVDIDTDIDTIVSTFGAPDDADVVIPETEATDLADAPARREDTELAAGVAAVAEVLLDIEIDTVVAIDGVFGSVSGYVRR